MSGDLQATIEFSVEFSSFHNVDLFQRGSVSYVDIAIFFSRDRFYCQLIRMGFSSFWIEKQLYVFDFVFVNLGGNLQNEFV